MKNPGSGAYDAYRVFAFVYSLSQFMNLGTHRDWFLTSMYALLGVGCLCVLLRPGSVAAFAGVNALLVAVFAYESPGTSNHLVFFAVTSATLLAALPLAARQDGRWRRPDPAAWLGSFAPALRVELGALYFLAVFHKLNWGYLHPEGSCAIVMFGRIAPAWLAEPVLAELPFRQLLIFGSLSLEAAVPLLLFVRATRPLGLAAGLLFHAFLGVGFPAFTTGLFALYALFVPSETWRGPRLAGTALARIRLGVIGFALVFAGARWWLGEPGPAPASARGLNLFLLWLWAAVWVALGAWLMLRRGGLQALRAPLAGGALPRPGLWIFPVLLLAIGLQPYLGLRTIPTFSMFSNLRTEGRRTNHLLMPDTAFRVASYQDDLVTLVDARPPQLRRLARQGAKLTWFTLRSGVQRLAATGATEIALVFERGGRRRAVLRAELDPELMEPIPWLERKWLAFRPIYATRGCRW